MIDLEHGHAIIGAYYAGEFRRLRQEITRKKRGELTTSQVAKTAVTDCGFEILPIPHILLIWLLLTYICSQN